MKQLYEANTSATPPAPPSPGETNYPQSGGAGVLATKPGAYFYYMVTRTLLDPITTAGLTPSATDMTQLTAAINVLATAVAQTAATVAARARTPAGVVVHAVWATAPEGWLRCNGSTISKSGAGGTGRANDDTAELYAHLWASHDNTVLTIQTSAGAPTGRGANAAADFAAGKRLPLPDTRGATLADFDDGAGRDPSGRALGSYLPDDVGPHIHAIRGVTSTLSNSTVDGFGNGPHTAIPGEESGTHGWITTNAAGDSLMQAPGGAQNKVRDVVQRVFISY